MFVRNPGAGFGAYVYDEYGALVGVLDWTGANELSAVFELDQGWSFMATTLETGDSMYRVYVRRLGSDGAPVPKPSPPERAPTPWSERRG